MGRKLRSCTKFSSSSNLQRLGWDKCRWKRCLCARFEVAMRLQLFLLQIEIARVLFSNIFFCLQRGASTESEYHQWLLVRSFHTAAWLDKTSTGELVRVSLLVQILKTPTYRQTSVGRIKNSYWNVLTCDYFVTLFGEGVFDSSGHLNKKSKL